MSSRQSEIIDKIVEALDKALSLKLITRELPQVDEFTQIPSMQIPFIAVTREMESTKQIGESRTPQNKVFMSVLDVTVSYFGRMETKPGEVFGGDTDGAIADLQKDIFKALMQYPEWSGLAIDTELKTHGKRVLMHPYFAFSMTISVQYQHLIDTL